MKLPAGIEQMNTNMSVELPPEQMFPVVRMVKSTKDGVDFLISMWTPFPEMRNEIISDYLQRGIEGLKAANISIKDT